jgi:hypothetical protein
MIIGMVRDKMLILILCNLMSKCGFIEVVFYQVDSVINSLKGKFRTINFEYSLMIGL